MIKFEIIKSNDGSDTLRNSILDETYHSTHGAIQEAMHVFINAGLNYFVEKNKSNKIKILEIGFGTGLNAILTLEAILFYENISLEYTAFEKYPVPVNVVTELNYLNKVSNPKLLIKIHEVPWEIKNQVTNQFSITKKQVDLLEYQEKHQYNLIYFDAFSPTKQLELWTKEVFRKMYESLSSNGVLVTYCAKGQVRRDLESIGFRVERIPGPPGKREMLRAIKPDIIL